MKHKHKFITDLDSGAYQYCLHCNTFRDIPHPISEDKWI